MSERLTVRPDFDAIDIDKIETLLDSHLADCQSVVDEVVSQTTPTWDSLMQPLSEVHNRLALFWSPISHLNSVMNSEPLREAYNRCLPKISAWYTRLGQNSALHNATLQLRNSGEYHQLSTEQQQQIKHDLRDFQLGGVDLSVSDKRRFEEISLELTQLSNRYSDNVLDASNAWQRHFDDVSALDGLPPSAIAAARQRAEGKGLEGYLLNLEFPCYLSVMMFANDRALREEMYLAYSTRASDEGPNAGEFDNSEAMQRILTLRAEKAELLGFETYAHLSVVPKMVSSPAQVLDFLEDLSTRARLIAKSEFDQLCSYARESLNMDDVRAWDVSYVSDRLKKHLHQLSDEDLKPYFPATKVIPGMFQVVSRLFGLQIDAVPNAPVYHPDVTLYAIRDREGNPRGEFYMDNYARENKRGGAWMDVCATRQRVGSRVQQPIAYLTCNLTPPVGDDPALLTHTEVTTLFHEFGHGLHHMLTQVETAGVSGINGVEWDAVELPSQFLENWCWERESIDMISSHYQTGEPLPSELLDRMRKARNFQSAMQLVRQLEFSLFDMRLHLDSRVNTPADIQQTLDQVRQQVAVVPVPISNRFQHSFSHIFAGGYSAGYFSYKWAEALSADAFSRFEEEGIFNAKVGQSFMQNVLEVGGSRDALTSFREFRGREPRVDALLRHSGLA